MYTHVGWDYSICISKEISYPCLCAWQPYYVEDHVCCCVEEMQL
jgi:hypothetical protein